MPGSCSTQVLEAFGPWVRLSQGVNDGALTSDPQVAPSVLAQHPLTAAALEGLTYDGDIEIFDAAVDAVSELVRCTIQGDPENPEVDPRAAPLASVLVPMIMKHRPLFQIEAEGNVWDEDLVKGFARLFAEVGEAYVALIATGAPEARRPFLHLATRVACPR